MSESTENTGKSSIMAILSTSHRRVTLLVWVGIFMNMLTVYTLNSWLPTLISDLGFSLKQAAIIGAMLQVGGTTGNITLGWLMDRMGVHRIVTGALIAAAFSIMSAAMGLNHLAALMLITFLIGFFINSSNSGWIVLSAQYYPTRMRATGTSWLTGIGRVGSIAGASLGGVLMSFGWSVRGIFLFLIVPVLIASVAAFMKGRQTGEA